MALADPMPPGDYDVTISGGAIQAGTLLPPAQLPTAGPLAVSIGTAQIHLPLPAVATIPGQFSDPVAGGTLSGTYTVTIPAADLTVDPTTGSATFDVAFYVSFAVQYAGFFTTSTTCTVGDAGNPVQLHMTTDAGSAWNAASGSFSLADKTFVVPAPTCANPTLQSVLGLLLGGTASGSNTASIGGQAVRRPDAPPPVAAQPPAITPPTPPEPPDLDDAEPLPVPPALAPDEALCIVPKLKGKLLHRAMRLLRRAGCRPGRITHVHSTKRPGTVLRQRVAPGRKLPRGAPVGLSVAVP